MMGPMYENVNNADFRMYFNNTLVYQFRPYEEGSMYLLAVNAESPIALAHDTLHSLVRLSGPADEPSRTQILGRDLFLSPNYLLHRWPVEYVPLGPQSFVRVSFEPVERRATKGTDYGTQRMLLPLDGPRGDGVVVELKEVQRRAIKRASTVTRDPSEAIARGMSAVLDIGHTRPVAHLLPIGEASARSHRMAIEMLTNPARSVFVPDFTTCLVKITAVKNPYAVVLYRGTVLGTVRLSDDKLIFTGKDNPTLPGEDGGPAQSLYRSAAGDVARKLFADRVVWPRKRTRLAPSAKVSTGG